MTPDPTPRQHPLEPHVHGTLLGLSSGVCAYAWLTDTLPLAKAITLGGLVFVVVFTLFALRRNP